MGKERNRSPAIEDGAAPPSKRRGGNKSESESEPDPDSDSDHDSRKSDGSRKRDKRHSKSRSSSSKRRRSRDSDSYTSSSESDDDSYDSESEPSEGEDRRRRRRERKRRRSEEKKEDSEPGSSEGEDRRRQRREKRRREEKKERRLREKEKERKRKRRDEKKRKTKKKEEKKRDKEKGKKGAVTNLWGKYGIIRETDMWNKRPEFTAWLHEVKKVNLESLANWEEKQLFKDFMEDHNTATFPSKKYYNLDAYFKHKMEKEMKKGFAKMQQSERTVFDDEEQRRLELQKERERHKEEQVRALKQSMQSGMAQAMKEQAQLREEMAYQYKLGNFEAAAAIQRRLDPDVAM